MKVCSFKEKGHLYILKILYMKFYILTRFFFFAVIFQIHLIFKDKVPGMCYTINSCISLIFFQFLLLTENLMKHHAQRWVHVSIALPSFLIFSGAYFDSGNENLIKNIQKPMCFSRKFNLCVLIHFHLNHQNVTLWEPL